MSTGLHQIWQKIERDERWQQLPQEEKLRRFDKFVGVFQERFGHKVTGLQGFQNNVRQRLARGPEQKEADLTADIAKAFNQDFLRAAQSKDPFQLLQGGVGDSDNDLRQILESEYIAMVEAGGEENIGLAGSIVGGFGHTLAKAAPVAGAGFLAAGPPGAVAGLTGASVAADSPVQFGHSVRANFFSLLDQGKNPDEAWSSAWKAATVSAGLTGVANVVPGGAFLRGAAKAVPGKGKAALGIKKALTAGDSFTGPARALSEAVKGGVDDVALEALNVAQERLVFGIDASEYRGTVGQRVAIVG